MGSRQYSPIDQILITADSALATLFGEPRGTGRPIPKAKTQTEQLSESERRQSESLMRVNHVGEVCAQALYHAQGFSSQDNQTRQHMQQAAEEESDHLLWCDERLKQLGGRKSYLNPVWYGGSFLLGTAAGLAGNRWNLGFLAETERQVVKHLDQHLGDLPTNDASSRAIVEQMREDEAQHAAMAVDAGAAELPGPIKSVMSFASKLMTRTAHWI